MKSLRAPWKCFPRAFPSLSSLNKSANIIISKLNITFYFQKNKLLCRSRKRWFGLLLTLSWNYSCLLKIFFFISCAGHSSIGYIYTSKLNGLWFILWTWSQLALHRSYQSIELSLLPSQNRVPKSKWSGKTDSLSLVAFSLCPGTVGTVQKQVRDHAND